jgi:hypothetical protein
MEPESHDEPTCGKGIAASAGLQESLAAFMRAMADMLQSHTRALDPKEPNGRAEIDAYNRIVSEHRSLGDRLDALAALMRGYRDLPVAAHDMDVIMDQRSLDAFTAMVLREQELSALLQERVKEHGEMLAAIHGEA